MQFLAGLLFGSLLFGEGMVGALLLAPLVVSAFILVGWGAYEAIVWFDISQASYQPAAWYAWPWHWPGAHLATEFLSPFSQPTQTNSAISIGAIFGWVDKFVHALLAIAINTMIAFLPFILLNKAAGVFIWIKGKSRNQSTTSAG